MNRITTVVPALALLACAASGPPGSVEPAPAPAAGTPNAPVTAEPAARAPAASGARVPSAPEPEPEPAPEPVLRRTPYPLPSVKPPYARSAHPGDGEWVPLARPADRAHEATPALHKTVLHPHAESRFIALTVVSIDLQAVSVHFMPGSEDVGTGKVPFAAGLVPAERQNALLAVFNGGFQPRHGRWGMKLGETTVVPPRDVGCTVALGKDSVRIRTFTALTDELPSFVAYRQTPPCLLEQGAVHPDLLAGRDKAWGGKAAGVVTRRRSALGIHASGDVLFYAIGVEATPRLLAEGLRAVGAAHAAELDINWNWTRFLLFGDNEQGKLRVSSSLVEGDYSKSGYVERPSERDFFYVVRR